MDNPTLTAERPNFLSLALQQLPPHDPNGREHWEKAVSEYLRLLALEEADAKFGAYAGGHDEYTRCKGNLERQYGNDIARNPQAKAEREAMVAALKRFEDVHYETYSKPLWAAEKALLNTPAPDLAAAMFKAEFIAHADMADTMENRLGAFQILASDLARISGEEGKSADPPIPGYHLREAV